MSFWRALSNTVLLAFALAAGVTWYLVGGIPLDPDEHGRVDVPGKATLTLPAGDARLHFLPDVRRLDKDNTTTDARPRDLRAAIRSRDGSRLAVENVPSRLHGIVSFLLADPAERRSQPFARADIPATGRYAVSIRAATNSGTILVGAKPWTPAGSPLVGAVLVFLLLASLVFVARWVFDVIF